MPKMACFIAINRNCSGLVRLRTNHCHQWSPARSSPKALAKHCQKLWFKSVLSEVWDIDGGMTAFVSHLSDNYFWFSIITLNPTLILSRCPVGTLKLSFQDVPRPPTAVTQQPSSPYQCLKLRSKPDLNQIFWQCFASALWGLVSSCQQMKQ